ncbi:unnamed protein product [Closterium sp. NIES-54]
MPSPHPDPPRTTPGRSITTTSTSSNSRGGGSAWGAEFGVRQAGGERDGDATSTAAAGAGSVGREGSGAAGAAGAGGAVGTAGTAGGWLSGERRSVLVGVLLSCATNALALLANFLDAEMRQLAHHQPLPPTHAPPFSSLAHSPARASPSPRSGAPSPGLLTSPSARLRGSGRSSGRWGGRGLGFGEELAGTAWGGKAGARGAEGEDALAGVREVRAIVEAVETKGLAALLALISPLREIQTKRAAHCIEAGGTLLLALQCLVPIPLHPCSSPTPHLGIPAPYLSPLPSPPPTPSRLLCVRCVHVLWARERIMELENDLFEEFSIQLLAFSVIQEAIFLNAAALEMVRDLHGFPRFSAFLRWAAFLFTKSSSELHPTLVLPPQPPPAPALPPSFSVAGDEVGGEVELPAIVARRDPKALLFEGSVLATPSRAASSPHTAAAAAAAVAANAAAAAAAAARPSLTLPASLRSGGKSGGTGGGGGGGGAVAAGAERSWAREKLLASSTFRRVTAERNSTDEALMAWNPHAAVACTVLCRFLADAMPAAALRRGHTFGHGHGHGHGGGYGQDMGWDADPEEYREQAAQCVAGALLGVFEQQLFTVHQLRRILGSLIAGAEHFRSARLWHALLSPIFFFFGAQTRPRQPLLSPRLLGPKAAALAAAPATAGAVAGVARGGAGGAGGEGQQWQSFARTSSVGEAAAGEAESGAGAAEGGLASGGSGGGSSRHGEGLVVLLDPALEYVNLPSSPDAERLRGDIVALVELAVSVDMGDGSATECALLLAALEACCAHPSAAALLAHALQRLLHSRGIDAVRELSAVPRLAAIIDRQHAAAAAALPSAMPPLTPSQLLPPRSVSLPVSALRPVHSAYSEEGEGAAAEWQGVRGAVFALLEGALGESDAALVDAACDPAVFVPLLRLLWESDNREFALRVLILLMHAPLLDPSAGQPLLECFFDLISHAASFTATGSAVAVTGEGGEEGGSREAVGVKRQGGAGGGGEEEEEGEKGESGGDGEEEVDTEGEGAAVDGRGEGGEQGEETGRRGGAEESSVAPGEATGSAAVVAGRSGGEGGAVEGRGGRVSARAVMLVDDLLSCTTYIVSDPPNAALQQRCVEAGALQHVLAVLDARYSPAHALTITLAALRCLTCLLAANQAAKVCLSCPPGPPRYNHSTCSMVRVAGAGYTGLQRRIEALTGGRAEQEVLDAVLCLATDGAYSASAHNTRATIQNGDALILWLSLLRTAPEQQAVGGLQQLQAMLADSTASCAECTRASLMWHLLHWLSTLDSLPLAPPLTSTAAHTATAIGAWGDGGEQQEAAGVGRGEGGGREGVVAAVALLVETMGRHSMSGKEITAVFHLLRQAGAGSRARHASLLLRTLLGAIKDEGPSGFFELNGVDSVSAPCYPRSGSSHALHCLMHHGLSTPPLPDAPWVVNSSTA